MIVVVADYWISTWITLHHGGIATAPDSRLRPRPERLVVIYGVRELVRKVVGLARTIEPDAASVDQLLKSGKWAVEPWPHRVQAFRPLCVTIPPTDLDVWKRVIGRIDAYLTSPGRPPEVGGQWALPVCDSPDP